MTNKDFIFQWVKGKIRNARHRNLLVNAGILYSYGLHYPLAKLENGRFYVNSRRYSNATSRHKGLVLRALRYIYPNAVIIQQELR